MQQPSTSCFSFSSQYVSIERKEMPRPQTGQKGSAGLLHCPRSLLTFLRARISDPHPEKEEDADAGEPDCRVPGPDRLDVREDADPRVDEPTTWNLQAEGWFHDFTL